MDHAPRFIYHHDGSFLHWVRPPISIEQFLQETLHWLTGSQVDAISCHMYSFGSPVPLYPTAIDAARAVWPETVPTVNIWKGIRNMQAIGAAGAAGVDYWARLVELVHAQGMQFWAAMRFNDQHPEEIGLRDRLTTDHPDYLIGMRCPQPKQMHHCEGTELTGYCNHVDYSERAVIEHRLALIEEVCTRYDVDVFDMDFNREGGHSFPADKVNDGEERLTAYVAQVRELLIRIGEKRGRPVGFFARVPGTLKACHDWQFEIERWIGEDLVDGLGPSVMYDTTIELPFDEFVAVAKGSKCRVYACPTEGVGPGLYRSPPASTLRAAAVVAWQQEVDGIYLMNFHHVVQRNETGDTQVTSELGDADKLSRRDKLYMVAGNGLAHQGRFFGMDRWTCHPRQLPCDVPIGDKGVTISFRMGDDLASARKAGVLASVKLLLDLLFVTGEEVFVLTVNGHAISFEDARSRISDQFDLNYGSTSGHFTFEFDLTANDCFVNGVNEVRLILKQRPPELRRTVTFYTLGVDVRYHLIPMGVA